jgi:hypothetical protein
VNRPFALAVIVACIFAQAAHAAKPVLDYREFKRGDAVDIAPDKAYILVRSFDLFGFRFARIDGDDGKVVRRENLVDMLGWIDIDVSNPFHTHLLEVRPGTYWLYGEKTEAYLEGPWLNCLCMGTVRFEAKPGVINDLGFIRDIDYESRGGKRPDARGVERHLLGNRDTRAVLVEPATERLVVPAVLAGMPRIIVGYRAAGFLPNIDGTKLDRISSIPGIIRFDRDHVIDDKTGQRLP